MTSCCDGHEHAKSGYPNGWKPTLIELLIAASIFIIICVIVWKNLLHV